MKCERPIELFTWSNRPWLQTDPCGVEAGGGMYMEFTFTGDPTTMMDRLCDDNRIASIAEHDEPLQTIVNSQLRDFYND